MAPLRWMTKAFKETDQAPSAPNFERDVILSSGNLHKEAPTKKFYDCVLSMVCYCLLKDPNIKQTTVVAQCISAWASLRDVHFWEKDSLGNYTHISLTEQKHVKGRTRPYLIYRFANWLGQEKQQAIMKPYQALQQDRTAATAVAPDKTASASVAGIAVLAKPSAMFPIPQSTSETATATASAPTTPSASTNVSFDPTAVGPSVAPSPPKKKPKKGDSLWQLQDIKPIRLEELLDELLDGLDTDDSTGPDSAKQQVKDYEIINGFNEDGNPIVLEIEDCPEFWQFLEDYRRKHGNTTRKAGREAKRRATGAATAVPKSTMRSLEDKPIDREEAWVREQVMLLEKTEEVMAALEVKGIVPPRKNWTWSVRDQAQTLLGSILSAGTLDIKLFDVIMAMRKLDLFEVKKLGTEDEQERKELLRKLQNLFLFCGFNYWTYGPANIMGACRRIHRANGKIPTDKKELLSFYGVAKKILMLILTDALGDQEAGIVCDIHLAHAFINLGWTDQNDTDEADKIGSEVQFWLEKEYWYRVNPVFAGLRQLWKVNSNHASILKEARKHGVEDFVGGVVADMRSEQDKQDKKPQCKIKSSAREKSRFDWRGRKESV